MFDLPVKTKPQRRAATQFRLLLLDLGYWRAQLSVYVRFNPTAAGSVAPIKAIKNGLPPDGDVRIVHITDKQWAKAIRFSNMDEAPAEAQPEQLGFF